MGRARNRAYTQRTGGRRSRSGTENSHFGRTHNCMRAGLSLLYPLWKLARTNDGTYFSSNTPTHTEKQRPPGRHVNKPRGTLAASVTRD